MTVKKITDTRFLKKNDEGYFYVAGSGKLPCDLCALNEVCPDRYMACRLMVPALSFINDEGLDDVSNTIRVGQAWNDRLSIGQHVALHSLRSGVFGYAKVLHVTSGPIDDMLAEHAHANHSMLEEEIEAAPQKLGRWLRQNYGPRIINETTKLTAIYILRDHRKDAAEIYARQKENWPVESSAQGVW